MCAVPDFPFQAHPPPISNSLPRHRTFIRHLGVAATGMHEPIERHLPIATHSDIITKPDNPVPRLFRCPRSASN